MESVMALVDPTRREMLASTAAAFAGVAAPRLSLCTFMVEVTIPLGHPCMGGGIAPAKEIVDPLFAHGFILQGAGEPVAVIAVDWCEIRNGAYDLFRDKIAAAIGTTPVRVMLSSLHQHDAPIPDIEAQQLLEKQKAKGSACDLAFLEKTVDRVADAAKKAMQKA